MKKTNYKPSGVLWWMTWNALGAVAVWLCVMRYAVWAEFPVACSLWMFAILNCLCACDPVMRAEIAANRRPVPGWLTHGSELVLAVFFLANGWWWTACAVGLLWAAHIVIHSDKEEAR